MNESMQPPATQCERWLQDSVLFFGKSQWDKLDPQSAVSLCLRSLHQLAAVPQEA